MKPLKELPRLSQMDHNSIHEHFIDIASKLSGRQFNKVEILGRIMQKGKMGYYSNSHYALQCACGNVFEATYHACYMQSPYSCGCIPRPRHPPIRLEGQTIGVLEVLRWAEDQRAWEVVCQECGSLLYVETVRELRRISKDMCEWHMKLQEVQQGRKAS
jgi:hypothetical protein